MAGSFKVNDADLSDFATTMRAMVSDMANALQLPDQPAAAMLGRPTATSLFLGQPQFAEASSLDTAYGLAYTHFASDFTALMNAFKDLAQVADTIAGNYKSASDGDVVSVKTVDADLNAAPASGG